MSPYDHVIVIADSLTNDFASPLDKFQNDSVHIGRNEIDRLMGAGEAYGNGPLPRFLKDVSQAGKPIHLAFIRDVHDPDDPAQMAELIRFGPHNIRGTPGCDFVPPVREIAKQAHVIDTSSLSLPLAGFRNMLAELMGRDMMEMSAEERGKVMFVLTGLHTNVRVLHVAATIRNDYEFPNVCVCPLLVGSRDVHAHMNALQRDLPNVLVRIVPGLPELYSICGLEADLEMIGRYGPVRIGPEDVVEKLGTDPAAILEALFLFYTSLDIKPLGGGFSGGLLFLVRGEIDGAAAAPEIVKIDRHMPMHREIRGYNRIRAFMGKQAPALSPPISRGDRTGVRMELASMSGSPQMLQQLYEKASDRATLDVFLKRYEYMMRGLEEKLYRNTRRRRWIYPYREFGLQSEQQRTWLRENIGHILPGQDLDAQEHETAAGLKFSNCIPLFEQATRSVDRLPAEICLSHGDLNFANMISDDMGNVWIIDWAYADYRPMEYDFAKMENDIKFVMSKDFGEEDLHLLLKFESYILEERVPADPDKLPPELNFVRSDFRFFRLYEAIRCVRRSFEHVREGASDVLHKIALLKFAAHTLSFDRNRGRGECDYPQLAYALLSLSILAGRLLKDNFHRKTDAEKPDVYPERALVAREKAPWAIDVPDYDPPYFAAPVVLEKDKTRISGGWADPENPAEVPGLADRLSCDGPLRFDTSGRPLNPAGRTGIGGRGLLGKWGPNQAVDLLATRINPWNGRFECLLVKRRDTGEWSLPGVLLLDSETPEQGAARAVRMKTGIELDSRKVIAIGQMRVDDFRNTDHAWIETTAFHYHLGEEESCELRPVAGENAVDVDWMELSVEVFRGLYANHAEIVKQTLARMVGGQTDSEQAEWIRELLKKV